MGTLVPMGEESQRDQSRLEQRAWRQKPSCRTSGSQVRSLGRAWHRLHNRNKSRGDQGAAVARSSNPGAGTKSDSRQGCVPRVWTERLCPHLALARAPVVNTLRAECPGDAPPDLRVRCAFFLPHNSALTCVSGQVGPLPPGQWG